MKPELRTQTDPLFFPVGMGEAGNLLRHARQRARAEGGAPPPAGKKDKKKGDGKKRKKGKE